MRITSLIVSGTPHARATSAPDVPVHTAPVPADADAAPEAGRVHDGEQHRESKALLREVEGAARRMLQAYAREHHGEERHIQRETKHALRDFRHEMRGAERDLHHGELDGTEFLARVGDAFEGLAGALGVSEAAGNAAPTGEEPHVQPTDTAEEDPGAGLRERIQAVRERFDAVAHDVSIDAGTAAETTGVRVDVQA